METSRFVELRRRLLELYPEIDDETLADTLEGATNLREAAAAVIRSALDDESLGKALKERLDTMKARLARLDARSSAKRQAALEAMEQAELRKLEEPDFTASLRLSPPSVLISDEASLPATYLAPQPPKPDKRAILGALLGGASVPGALLANSKTTLSVRSQ